MRRLSWLLVIAIIVFCGTALAAGPTNPYFNEVHYPAPRTFSRSSREIVVGIPAGSQRTFDSVGQIGSWSGVAYYVERDENGELMRDEAGNLLWEEGDFEFRFFMSYAVKEAGSATETLTTHGYRTYGTDNEYSYRFVIPGKYYLRVEVVDAYGNTAYADYDIHVTDDNAITEEEKIAQIISECKKAGCTTEFEKALWLHDWLTANAYYDYSLSYYSSDGVLIRGTGVCDSFTKAYSKLLKEVGIASIYFPSPDMNHSWNLVRLDGDWYHIDVTWDDSTPSGTTDLVCGRENHIYFGLPDELMASDHTYEPYLVCDSYENNYFLKTGKVKMWSEGLAEKVQIGIDKGMKSFSVTVPASYRNEHGSYSYDDHAIVYGLAAYDLDKSTWKTDLGEHDLSVSYDSANKRLVVLDRTKANVLFMPSALEKIGSGAFAGISAFDYVLLPNEDVEVGEGAFDEGINVWVK